MFKLRLLWGILIFFAFPRAVNAQVVINEFLPKPSSGNPEWVEFYNSGSSQVDLSDYYFDDDNNFSSDSGSLPKIAISGLLESQKLCYWELPNYLNNNGDTPTLFKTDGSTIDTYLYTTTVEDLTYARVPDGGSWQAGQISSKPIDKCFDLAPSPTPTPTVAPTSSPIASSAPTAAPTKTPTPSPTKTPTATSISTTLMKETPDLSVLALQTYATTEPEESTSSSETINWANGLPIIPIILIILGVSTFGGSGVMYFRKRKVEKTKFNETYPSDDQ